MDCPAPSHFLESGRELQEQDGGTRISSSCLWLEGAEEDRTEQSELHPLLSLTWTPSLKRGSSSSHTQQSKQWRRYRQPEELRGAQEMTHKSKTSFCCLILVLDTQHTLLLSSNFTGPLNLLLLALQFCLAKLQLLLGGAELRKNLDCGGYSTLVHLHSTDANTSPAQTAFFLSLTLLFLSSNREKDSIDEFRSCSTVFRRCSSRAEVSNSAITCTHP